MLTLRATPNLRLILPALAAMCGCQVVDRVLAPCQTPPQRRPADYEVRLWHRGGEPESRREWSVSEGPCRLKEIPVWFPEHARFCVPVDAAAMDRLFDDFRARRFHVMRTRELKQFSPHRGGFSLGVAWGGQQCQVSDSLMFEVPRRWQADYQHLTGRVSGVINRSRARIPVDRWGRPRGTSR